MGKEVANKTADKSAMKKQSSIKATKTGSELKQLKAQLDIAIKKAKLAKSEAAIERQNRIGSARGIESMFRSSYRAQLDMIALAATKSNIMISLNGLLVSILLLSGVYFMSTEKLLLVPVALLLLTCTVAIIFAVLSARPDVDKRDLTLEDFTSDEADILVFEQFSKLTSEEFDSVMWDMLADQERIYHNMISHIYYMGCIADKKFALLHISYNSFMIGLVFSVSSLIAIMGYYVFI